MALDITFENTTLSERDVALIRSKRGGWLNDNLVQVDMDYLEFKELDNVQRQSIGFVGPSVLHLAKSMPDVAAELLDPLSLRSKDVAFALVNDHATHTSAGGSHWALLAYTRAAAHEFVYVDSMLADDDDDCALPAHVNKAVDVLWPAIASDGNDERRCKIVALGGVPQQSNSSDCGLYALMFMRRWVAMFAAKAGHGGVVRVDDLLDDFRAHVTPKSVDEYRRTFLDRFAK
jgi:sentrin-specific protease 8